MPHTYTSQPTYPIHTPLNTHLHRGNMSATRSHWTWSDCTSGTTLLLWHDGEVPLQERLPTRGAQEMYLPGQWNMERQFPKLPTLADFMCAYLYAALPYCCKTGLINVCCWSIFFFFAIFQMCWVFMVWNVLRWIHGVGWQHRCKVFFELILQWKGVGLSWLASK